MNETSVLGSTPTVSPALVSAPRCLRSRARVSTCDVCVKACPANAISLDPAVAVDDKCTGCGICFHVCPTGVFSGRDLARELNDCVRRLGDVETLELVCAAHANPGYGPVSSTAVVRIGGCLACIGPATLLSLLAAGTRRIVVRADACEGCSPWNAGGGLRGILTETREILAAVGQAERLPDWSNAAAGPWGERTVVDANNPPVSRRDMFRLLAAQAPGVVATVMGLETAAPAVEERKTPPVERRRLANALRRMTGLQSDAPPDVRMLHARMPQAFSSLAVNDDCTACQVCVRACPTGALDMPATENAYRLLLDVAACVHCGLCIQLCQPGASSQAGPPTVRDFLATEKRELHAGQLRRCPQCGARFGGRPDARLCPVCEYRTTHPFGSVMPSSPVRMRADR